MMGLIGETIVRRQRAMGTDAPGLLCGLSAAVPRGGVSSSLLGAGSAESDPCSLLTGT